MPKAQPSATNARQNPNLYKTRSSMPYSRKMDKQQRTQSIDSIKNNSLRNKK